MSYSSKGTLSIVDRKGRYMGMQNIAGGFLSGCCIHISTQGPENNPTAVIITVYDKDDAGKNFEDINFSAMKADYDENATPRSFVTILKSATRHYAIKKRLGDETLKYCIYANNGLVYSVSYETFDNPNIDFSKRNFETIK